MIKVRGFTIIELILVMIISSLIVGMSFWSYSSISNYYFKSDLKKNKTLDVQRINFLLHKDFANANVIAMHQPNALIFRTNSDSVIYYFNDKIIRNQMNAIDTFYFTNKIDVKRFNSSFNVPNNIIERLTLNVEIENRNIKFEFSKLYSAEELVKLQKND